MCNCPTCGRDLHDAAYNVDQDAGIIVGNGRFAQLTIHEFELYQTLAERPGRVVSKETLMTALYRIESDEPAQKIIDVFICNIRRKLKPLGIAIGTSWGRGYRLELRASE